MKKLAFVIGVLALGFAASTAARADFAVIKFKDTGACRAWYNDASKPWGHTQVLWVRGRRLGTLPRRRAPTP